MSKKSWYVLRIVAGLYLTYLGINLFRGRMSGSMNKAFVMFISFIFVVVGVLYAASSIKKVWAMRNEEPIDEVVEDGEDEADEAESEEDQEDEADGAESEEDTDKLKSGESENNIPENADDNDVDEN